MKLSGMQPYGAIQNYYNINSGSTVANVSGISSVSGTGIGNSQSQNTPERDKLADALEREAARSRQTFDSYDFSKNYNPNATYSMKGKDSDLASLDVPNSTAASNRDATLQQYSYFVKPDQLTNEQTQSKDALENFMLF